MKKYHMRLLYFLLSLCIGIQVMAQTNPIIPKPVSYQSLATAGVKLDASSKIVGPAKYQAQLQYLQASLKQQTGLQLSINKQVPKSGSYLLIQEDPTQIDKAEMYLLESKGNEIKITVKDIRGLVNAIQTLLQICPLQKSSSFEVPAVAIKDYPRFEYRGMHLDVVRHMFPLEFIKKYIDYLTFHKFNTFHWHLTDDQGWRIEILSYPKLNSIGSWRNATLIGHFKDTPARYDSTRYGGFYTRKEVKEVIAYAALRGIEVIPEIDIPGHSRATITAYPEFSTKPDTTWNVATTWGMYNRQNNVLAPRPATFTFLRTIFHEISDLFPSKYIHVGGDECSKLWWKADPFSQAFMKEKGLKDEHALQTYFISQSAKYLKEKNKQVIGWHEILEGELDTSAIVMNWGGAKEGIEAGKLKHRVIMTPGKPYYFDHYQSHDPNDSLAIHGYNTMDSVYQYDPVPAALRDAKLDQYIIGGQANVWTEYMGYGTKVEYMIFPRMTALSESLWTPAEQKNLDDFRNRLKQNMQPRYDFWGAHYFKQWEQWTRDKQ
ncbi:MAG: beta-N-acetylhexosaminidase [Bacteroidetes bacterium 24-39-8]|nr:MAG: beta-N-acetylhexosaminidase [Sphingobacteriia bacterium 35-40-8]OYZ51241.1 MAG: beta-N-acetylhexosaminidase [Bacteroidetes bacterium 24-39-8]OZA68769.1 MAG: beta-N-acetylhexosaminidase [Sphingobacteriia bacterium 39-39-8]